MKCKAAVFDIDGTLLPRGSAQVSAHVKKALAALRASGTAILIATGRPLFAARPVLTGVPFDYIVCANGGWVADADGRALHTEKMTSEEMYALVDFCEDYEVPLSFTFPDGFYTYVEGERLMAMYRMFPGIGDCLHDGEDQVRHLEGMPYAAIAFMEPAQTQAFERRYGYLGIRIIPFAPGKCDVLRPGVDKALAVERLLHSELGADWSDTAAFGDGSNDLELLTRAGFGVAMAGSCAALRSAAQLVAPPCSEDGVASVVLSQLL